MCTFVFVVPDRRPEFHHFCSREQITTEQTAAVLHLNSHHRRLQVCRQPEFTETVLPHISGRLFKLPPPPPQFSWFVVSLSVKAHRHQFKNSCPI